VSRFWGSDPGALGCLEGIDGWEDSFCPILPVIPKRCLKNGRQSGLEVLMSFLDEGWLWQVSQVSMKDDILEVPTGPYYIFCANDGYSMREHTPLRAREIMMEKGELPLTTEECIALVIHTKVLVQDYGLIANELIACGSNYMTMLIDGGNSVVDTMPSIYHSPPVFRGEGTIALHFAVADGQYDWLRKPACSLRKRF